MDGAPGYQTLREQVLCFMTVTPHSRDPRETIDFKVNMFSLKYNVKQLGGSWNNHISVLDNRTLIVYEFVCFLGFKLHVLFSI